MDEKLESNMEDRKVQSPVMTRAGTPKEKESLADILAKGYGDPRFYELLKKMAILHGSKNKDYAQGGKQGHLGNFTRVSAIKNLYPGFNWSSPFGTAIDYLLKQLDAAMILYSVGRKSVTGENIPERLQDVSIYSGIGTLLWQDEMMPDAKPQEIDVPNLMNQVPRSSTPLNCPTCGYPHETLSNSSPF